MEKKLVYKKALSPVIAAMMMIAITLAAVLIVWGVVQNVVNKELDEVEACSNIVDKVQINSLYTCYNATDDLLQFSINIKDIEVDSLLVSVSSAGSSKSFELPSTPDTVAGVRNYTDDGTTIFLPGKNTGFTYLYDMSSFSETPDRLEIAPVINSNQCSKSDSLDEFPLCSSLL